jgi:NAD(P)-dependent dehydrogenase (short-subunit alcohol dehydrogenase family)
MSKKTMVITGAGRGIGAALARMAAQRGYAVAVNYARNAAAADALVQEIHAAGGEAVAIQADVSQPAGAAHLFEQVDERLGRVDVLVNNAGIVGRTALIDDMDPAALAEVFATNVFSYFYSAGEAVKRMSTRHGGPGGVIVNLSSAAARHGGFPKEIAYASSKGAVDAFTLGLAKEVARDGIRVNALRPGIIETTMHDAHGGQATIDAVGATVPIGRAGVPDEVAEAVLWLASPASSYVHGALIDVSGGR